MFYKYLIILTLSLFLTSCADKNISADMANESVRETNITTSYGKTWCHLVDKLENSGGIVLKSAYKSIWDLDTIYPNTDPVCTLYMDALNNYRYYGHPILPPEDIFFDNPMRPKVSDFKFPEWRQLDIYEHKDLYLKIWGEADGILSEEQRAKLEKAWLGKQWKSNPELTMRIYQMYYTRFDIDQDGISENIVRFDANKYATLKDFAYINKFIIFKDKEEMSFKYMDREFSDLFYRERKIHGLFSYKGKSYVTEVRFNRKDYIYPMGFYYLIIKELNSDKKLEDLCLITRIYYEGLKDVK